MRLHYSVVVMALFLIVFALMNTSAAIPQAHDSPRPSPSTANVAGRYSVVGTNPDGGQYTGSLEIVAQGSVYQFRWNAGTQYDGVGVKNGRTIAVAFANGSDGSGCGVVDYTVLSDGRLDGKWGYWGTNASGTERANRISGRGLQGEYSAAGMNPNGTRYQVNISVREAGGRYKFTWSNQSEGFGILRGDNLAVGIGGERCGFVVYEIKPDGSLDGVWGGSGTERTGTEKAKKQ
jgi:hypothetical protein